MSENFGFNHPCLVDQDQNCSFGCFLLTFSVKLLKIAKVSFKENIKMENILDNLVFIENVTILSMLFYLDILQNKNILIFFTHLIT